MADYTVAHLKRDVDDQGPNLGLAPNMQLRMARVPLGCENCGVSYISLVPNYRQPVGHRHKVQEEVFVLTSGSGRVKLNDEIFDLEPWAAVRVAPGVLRCFESGPDGAEFIGIGAPNTGPGDA